MEFLKKRKTLTLLVAMVAGVVAVASVCMVVAYMFRKSPEITNQFVPAQVDCKVVETRQEDGTKTSVKVQNTGNFDAYIRVRVVTYWQDSKGNPVARTSPVNQFDSGGWSYNTDAWIYDRANQTFYHKAPVKVGKNTEELLNLTNSFKGIKLEAVVETVNKVDYTYHPVVEFVLEGIQSNPAEAVEKWGATLQNGNISSVSGS